MAHYCTTCPWTGDSLAAAFGHAQVWPGHLTSEQDVDSAERQARQLEERAAELLRQANEIRRRAGLIAEPASGDAGR